MGLVGLVKFEMRHLEFASAYYLFVYSLLMKLIGNLHLLPSAIPLLFEAGLKNFL